MIWIDKANSLFQIPWKHGSRREWEHSTDAKLFQMWARHTGKNELIGFFYSVLFFDDDKQLIRCWGKGHI